MESRREHAVHLIDAVGRRARANVPVEDAGIDERAAELPDGHAVFHVRALALQRRNARFGLIGRSHAHRARLRSRSGHGRRHDLLREGKLLCRRSSEDWKLIERLPMTGDPPRVLNMVGPRRARPSPCLSRGSRGTTRATGGGRGGPPRLGDIEERHRQGTKLSQLSAHAPGWCVAHVVIT